MNGQTYNVAFGVAVDKAYLPSGTDVPSEIRNRVRRMVNDATYNLWGVSFDPDSVLVTEVDGVRLHTVSFQLSIENEDNWASADLKDEIVRRTAAMVAQQIALYHLVGVSFDPATVCATRVVAQRPAEQPTAPVDMRPGARTPATVPTTPVFVEPVAAAPAKRGWRRLFGRG